MKVIYIIIIVSLLQYIGFGNSLERGKRIGNFRESPSDRATACKFRAMAACGGGCDEGCQYGFYCDGMNDNLMKSSCVGGECVCSGKFTQQNCLPNVARCVMKYNTTTDSPHPGAVCTEISENIICSDDFMTYNCYDDTNPTREIHVLGSYQARSCCSEVPESSEVHILKHNSSRRQVILVLTSTRPVAWHLVMDDDVILEHVILVSNDATLMTVSWKNGQVKEVTKLTNIVEGQNDVYGRGHGTIKLLQHLEEYYGAITSFTGRYQVKEWRLKIGWPVSSNTTSSTTMVTTKPLKSSATKSESPSLSTSTNGQSDNTVTKTVSTIPVMSVFNARGTLQFRHISGLYYHANGTLQINDLQTTTSTIVTPEMTSTPSLTSLLTTTSPIDRSSSPTKITSSSPSDVVTSSSAPIERCSSSPCHVNAICRDTSTGVSCSCQDGYTGDGRTNCQALERCKDNPCHQNARCVDVIDGVTCSCKTGFNGDGRMKCDDIDECTGDPCPTNSICQNTIGSYKCSCREPGSCKYTRLAGMSSKTSGRVEVLRNGAWGTVCADGWDSNDAQVVCREVGYPHLAGILNDILVPDGKGQVWLANVRCNGSESKLSECGYSAVPIYCTHFYDVGVVCEPTNVRITGMGLPDEGRVEVYHNGEWGTICGNNWMVDQADIVCRELGFDGADYDLYDYEVPDGTGRIWLDNVECSGRVFNLTDCKHDGWGVHACDHTMDIGVKCTMTLTCNFEVSTCSWRTEQQGGDFEWQRNHGGTPTILTGPDYDYTLKTKLGAYMYIETSGRSPGEKAFLVSPPLDAMSYKCLRFYFHMWGSDLAQLNVNLRNVNTSVVTRLWNFNSSKKKWVIALVPLNFAEQSQIIFEAVSGNDQNSDIAIDDVTHLDTPCTIYPTSATPDSNECLMNPCHVNATCLDMIGTYTCQCKKGFTGNGTHCSDIDECLTNPCHVNATCHNTVGAYHCTCNINTEGICDDAYAPCGLRHAYLRAQVKIIGGNKAVKNSWPWQAAILSSRKPGSVWCGGALINHRYVLTAAHCFDIGTNTKEYTVILGEHDTLNREAEEQVSTVKTIIVHQNYKTPSKNYDIALVELSTPMNYTASVSPICISEKQLAPGTECYVSGWGTRTSGKTDFPQFLHQAKLPLIKQSDCEAMYSFTTITDTMICAGYTSGTIDTCQGDSGGPLVCEDDHRWYIAGLTSFGADCASVGYPGVYANVYTLRNWITNQLQTQNKRTFKIIN